MCTASWLASEAGYTLFFNRDERRQRQPARPPRRRVHQGEVLLAPEDGDFGGTWIASNAHGLTVALLNRYQDAVHEGPGPFTSRGLLVLDLAVHPDLATLRGALEATDLEQYRAFTLLLVEAAGSSRRAIWNGRQLALPATVSPPLASSGHDPLGIDGRRRTLFEQQVGASGSAEHLFDFHRSHLPERGPLSPCMHRPDASTVSLTRVVVTPHQVAMAYAPGPPCRAPLGTPETLPRHDPA